MDTQFIFRTTINELVASQQLCHMYFWADEPSKFSTAWIHKQSEFFCLASIFDLDGAFEGLMCLRLEDIHRISFDNSSTELLENVPKLERGIAAKTFVPFTHCEDFESFVQILIASKELCEVMNEDLESFVGRPLAADEFSILIEHYDPIDNAFDGKSLFDLEMIHYIWAHTKRVKAIS